MEELKELLIERGRDCDALSDCETTEPMILYYKILSIAYLRVAAVIHGKLPAELLTSKTETVDRYLKSNKTLGE